MWQTCPVWAVEVRGGVCGNLPISGGRTQFMAVALHAVRDRRKGYLVLLLYRACFPQSLNEEKLRCEAPDLSELKC